MPGWTGDNYYNPSLNWKDSWDLKLLNQKRKEPFDESFIDLMVKRKQAVRHGWSSFTFVKENIQRLYRYWNTKFKEIDAVLEDKKTYPHIWIFYSGDCDPSGRRMDINLEKELMKKFRKRFVNVVMTNVITFVGSIFIVYRCKTSIVSIYPAFWRT
jgi:hypothetical protein